MSLDSKLLNFIGWNYFVIFIFSCIYIFVKRNKHNSYSILIIYSIFITSIYFVQPFIISIDYIIAYYIKYKNITDFKNSISYKVILYIYLIIGWAGTIFSDFIIPFCKNYYFSGYFTKSQKIKDCIFRWLKKYLLLYLIYVSYIIVTYKFRSKEIINKFGNYADFILNILNIKGLFSVLFYFANYFPIFVNQVRCSNEKMIGILAEELDHDQKLLIESIKDLTFVIQKYIKENTKIEIINNKKEIEDLIGNVNLNEYVKNKELNIDLKLTENEEENIRIKLNLENAIDVIAKWTRNFKKCLLNIPRKIYMLIRIRHVNIPNPFVFLFFILLVLFELTNFFNIFGIEKNVTILKDYYLKYLFTYFFCLVFFIVIFHSLKRTNFYTENNIYSMGMSDPLCLMEYSERISNLLIPMTFIYISSMRFFVYEADINLIFREIFQIPIFDNIIIFGFDNIRFDKYLKEYYIIRLSIIIFLCILCFTVRKISIKCCCCCCCKKKCYLYKVKINDTLESPFWSNKYKELGKTSKYKELIDQLEQGNLTDSLNEPENIIELNN